MGLYSQGRDTERSLERNGAPSRTPAKVQDLIRLRRILQAGDLRRKELFDEADCHELELTL